MNFTEFRFVFFLLAVLAVHWSLRGLTARKVWLLACSYAFYASWDWRFLSLILLSTAVDFVAGKAIGDSSSQGKRRAWMGVSLAANLGILGVFKYLGFFVESAGQFLDWIGLPADLPSLSIVLPLGISFFTFQTLSYTIDVHRGRLQPTRSLLDMSLFVAFFPQLVAGPIVRARRFLPQLEKERSFPFAELRPLLLLFLVGFFKKACVADNLSPLVDAYFADPGAYDLVSAWSAVLLFMAQLYCDFSGYSDIAIASAGLLGYTLPQNFDFPYLQPNLTRAWQGWHISMTQWFRDYVYAPLGGRRGSRLQGIRNTMLTMGVVGLWHGAHWHFILWGLLHGVGLVVHQGWASWRRAPEAPRRGLSWGILLTFLWATLTIVPFRSPDLAVAGQVFYALSGLGEAGAKGFGSGPLAAFGLLALLHFLAYRRVLSGLWPRLPSWAFAGLCGLFVALILAFMRSELQPFVYFQF